MHRIARKLALAFLGGLASVLLAQAPREPVNLNDLKSDLVIPEVTEGKPAPGCRVRQVNPGHEGWDLHHLLYLPTDWKPGGKYPVIVEYPGNGGYQNKLGDRSTGLVEGCTLGYGAGAGKQFIWVSLPFVDVKAKRHAITWWGDADATAAYCRQTVARICQEYGGDPDAVILAGFSRGAIACNYIGLRDDATAKLWRAMIVHSHYDGVRRWGYPDDDAESARKRLARFQGKPQWISHEGSTAPMREFLKGADLRTTFVDLPYPNHSALWVLKDIPERAHLRRWLAEVLR